MNCKKHLGISIPCPNCLYDEYKYFIKVNEIALLNGEVPPNDLTDIERELKKIGVIQ